MAMTIRDIAREAGVSTATVSRALRGLPNVDPVTRERVKQVAERLDYVVSPEQALAFATTLASEDAGSVEAFDADVSKVDQVQALVAEAVRRIDAGELDKVVLARDVVVTTSAPIDTRHLLTRLADRYPSCWTFMVDGLIGATPEMLVRRTGDEVTSRVLAGTMRRSSDASSR